VDDNATVQSSCRCFCFRIRDIRRELYPGLHGCAWRVPGAHARRDVDAFAPTSEHGTPPSVLRCELQPLGYREISLDRLEGSNAYLAIFAPRSVASRMWPEAMVPVQDA
jgi:hypothetical protein